MYSLYNYGQMLADKPRMDAYIAALRRSVNKDSVVLDLGCGPGIFSMIACQLGARRVYAVDPNPSIQIAREAAHTNGFADKIEFFEGISGDLRLTERVDTIISDLRGVLPWYEELVPAIIDARERLLKPGGQLIPQRDLLFAAVVEAPEKYAELVGPWETNDFDCSSARKVATNTWRKTHVSPQQLLCEPVCWKVLDYYAVNNADLTEELSLQINRSGKAHGFILWFDAELIEGIGFSNAPDKPALIYGNGLFLFSDPVDVVESDLVNLRIEAKLINGGYVWRWDTKILTEANEVKCQFRQSTLFGTPLSTTKLRKQSSAFRPDLTESGKVEHFILSLMTGTYSLEEIAEQLQKEFPQRYSDWHQALNDVSTLSAEFSE